jgi:transposase-like protein
MESKKKHTPTYTAEFRERGVRLYREHRPDYTSDNAAYRAIASKLGCSHDTLRAWCLQAASDAGERAGLTTTERATSVQGMRLPSASTTWTGASRRAGSNSD